MLNSPDKPQKAKEHVKIFKLAVLYFESLGSKNLKEYTNFVGTYWTVVFESETEDIGGYNNNLRSATMSDELKDIRKGYIDCIGGRVIFMIE